MYLLVTLFGEGALLFSFSGIFGGFPFWHLELIKSICLKSSLKIMTFRNFSQSFLPGRPA
jgi:hypothetical protein